LNRKKVDAIVRGKVFAAEFKCFFILFYYSNNIIPTINNSVLLVINTKINSVHTRNTIRGLRKYISFRLEFNATVIL